MKKHEEFTTKDGKRMRVSLLNEQELVADKLKNNPMLEVHKSQIDLIHKSTGKVVDRRFLHYDDAVKYGDSQVKSRPELKYQIVQIVE